MGLISPGLLTSFDLSESLESDRRTRRLRLATSFLTKLNTIRSSSSNMVKTLPPSNSPMKPPTSPRKECTMTSSIGNIFRVTGYLCGEFTGPGEIPTQRPVMRTFDVFFDLRLNKRLSKQWWGWWFETLSCPLWRHRNGPGWRHDIEMLPSLLALMKAIHWSPVDSPYKG